MESQNTRQKGDEAENCACAFLESRDYVIVQRNFNTRFGEIDIIAQKGGILHFVEVKSGVGFEPIYNISPKKMRNLTQTLNIYLSKNRIKMPYCLSALILSKKHEQEDFKIEWLENLTLF